MSMQHEPPAQAPAPSVAIPIAILAALAIEVVFSVSRFAMPIEWLISERYWLVSTGVYASSALLAMMGFADLVRRLSDRQAMGARIAMIGHGVFLVLALCSGLVTMLGVTFGGEKMELVWTIQSYLYFATTFATTIGTIVAAGSFDRIAVPAVGMLVLSGMIAPPPFLGMTLHDLFGTSTRYVYPLFGVGQLALQVVLVRFAARTSTRPLPTEPTAPFALLGAALRARVIAMFIVILFTLVAMGGRSIGAMKVALVGAPIINILAFVVFSVAALRATRGLTHGLQIAFTAAGAASTWCAGILSMQTPAIYQMLTQSADSYTSDRAIEMARALPLVMPLVATAAVVIALVAAGSYVRRIGHQEVADSIGPRTTTFVILMATNVAVQIYAVPKVRSMGELFGLSIVSVIAGVAALLVAANLFKRASDATSTTALPTATALP
ncbi:MAG: hypothetical protein ACKV2T_34375 [Kofleriaceae bacterium]